MSNKVEKNVKLETEIKKAILLKVIFDPVEMGKSFQKKGVGAEDKHRGHTQ